VAEVSFLLTGLLTGGTMDYACAAEEILGAGWRPHKRRRSLPTTKARMK
jgi:hypothetical protein